MKTKLQIALDIIKKTNPMLKKSFCRAGASILKLKKHHEIVTAMDIKANDYIISVLKENFPEHSIISEETPPINKGKKEIWYVDPLDGTTNFAYGFTEFATCLALVENNKITLGVIGIPYMNEIYSARAGAPAKCGNKNIHVSSTKKIKDSFLFFCAGHTPSGRERFLKFINKINSRRCHFRIFASAGIELSSVACGRADGCVITDIHNWDVCAGALLVRQSGGKVTDFSGKDWTPGDKTLIATNGLLHNELLALSRNL